MHAPYALVLLPALIGVALGAVAYFSAGTGVDGTAGALLALVGAGAIVLGSLLGLTPVPGGWVRGLLDALLGLGALLTAVAAYFLMQPVFAAVMLLALLGLLAAVLLRGRGVAR